MKIAIIGGAGVRTPLLVKGLASSDLPLTDLALYDTDQPRLALIGGLARRVAGKVHVTLCARPEESLEGADFVITGIRVGGMEARARDEAIALDHGCVGQETCGPAGLALALRTIPVMLSYARMVERRAPKAWLINFTNPVGIITQAVLNNSGAKMVGICDTPTELFEEVAGRVGAPSSECRFDYGGLNHLGWVREVFHRGEPQLARLLKNPAKLAALYRTNLFSPTFLERLGMLPTEYLFYYYRTRDAVGNLTSAGTSRGRRLVEMNRQFFEDLAQSSDAVTTYERYLAERNSSYMQIESGAKAAIPPSPWAQLTGYDKIGLAVVRAIHFNTNTVLPLNVLNRGNIPELADDDVVEVPCAVGANGPVPLHVGSLPKKVQPLLLRVKSYERLTIQAALSKSKAQAARALAQNPTVRSAKKAQALVKALELFR